MAASAHPTPRPPPEGRRRTGRFDRQPGLAPPGDEHGADTQTHTLTVQGAIRLPDHGTGNMEGSMNQADKPAGFVRSQFSLGIDEYVPYKSKTGNKSHALVLRKNGEWLAGWGEDKCADFALMFENLGPEAVAEVFKKAAIRLAEIRQSAGSGRAKTQATTLETLL